MEQQVAAFFGFSESVGSNIDSHYGATLSGKENLSIIKLDY